MHGFEAFGMPHDRGICQVSGVGVCHVGGAASRDFVHMLVHHVRGLPTLDD